MPEPGFFKTATFGGFDKKSVLYYIDTLNENFQNTEKEYQEKLWKSAGIPARAYSQPGGAARRTERQA